MISGKLSWNLKDEQLFIQKKKEKKISDQKTTT